MQRDGGRGPILGGRGPAVSEWRLFGVVVNPFAPSPLRRPPQCSLADSSGVKERE